jgi:hypothetical protein
VRKAIRVYIKQKAIALGATFNISLQNYNRNLIECPPRFKTVLPLLVVACHVTVFENQTFFADFWDTFDQSCY